MRSARAASTLLALPLIAYAASADGTTARAATLSPGQIQPANLDKRRPPHGAVPAQPSEKMPVIPPEMSAEEQEALRRAIEQAKRNTEDLARRFRDAIINRSQDPE